MKKQTRWCHKPDGDCASRGVEDVCFKHDCPNSDEDPSRVFDGSPEMKRAIEYFSPSLSKIKSLKSFLVYPSEVDGCFNIDLVTKFGEVVCFVVRLDIINMIRERIKLSVSIETIFEKIEKKFDVSDNIKELFEKIFEKNA